MASATLTDLTVHTIHAFIEEERKRSFAFLANHTHELMSAESLLVVVPTDADDASIPQRKRSLQPPQDAQWYTFTEPNEPNAMRHTVAIYSPSGNSEHTDIDSLEIFNPLASTNEKVCTPAAKWIRETYDWSEQLNWDMRYPEQLLTEQRLWWDNNGMHFRLLQLPLELRENVYLQIIGPVVVPDVHRGKVTLGRGLRYAQAKRQGHLRDPDIEAPNLALMGICKQVREEAMEVSHRDTTKRLCTPGDGRTGHLAAKPRAGIFSILQGVEATLQNTNFLRSVQLELTAAQYFLSIRFCPTKGHPWNQSRAGWRLNRLYSIPTLRSLDFRFISPKNPGAVCPWNQVTKSENGHSCQKIWIDWFFTFAWLHMRAMAMQGVTFTLSGCIKDSTKAHWQHILNDRRANHTAYIERRQKEIMEAKTEDGPIPCQCTTLCTKGGPALFKCTDHEMRMIEGLQEEVQKVYWNYDD